jgi:hypothetical protein
MLKVSWASVWRHQTNNPPADDERVFLIDQALEFRFGSLDGYATFSWADLSGDEGDLWEFVCSKVGHIMMSMTDHPQTVGTATSKLFEVTLLQCVYERKFQRSHDLASEEDLEALKYVEPEPVVAPPAALEGSPSRAAAAVPAAVAAADEEDEDPFKDVPVLHTAKAEMYLFDTEADLFVIQERDVDADLASNGLYDSESKSMSLC